MKKIKEIFYGDILFDLTSWMSDQLLFAKFRRKVGINTSKLIEFMDNLQCALYIDYVESFLQEKGYFKQSERCFIKNDLVVSNKTLCLSSEKIYEDIFIAISIRYDNETKWDDFAKDMKIALNMKKHIDFSQIPKTLGTILEFDRMNSLIADYEKLEPILFQGDNSW